MSKSRTVDGSASRTRRMFSVEQRGPRHTLTGWAILECRCWSPAMQERHSDSYSQMRDLVRSRSRDVPVPGEFVKVDHRIKHPGIACEHRVAHAHAGATVGIVSPHERIATMFGEAEDLGTLVRQHFGELTGLLGDQCEERVERIIQLMESRVVEVSVAQRIQGIVVDALVLIEDATIRAVVQEALEGHIRKCHVQAPIQTAIARSAARAAAGE